MSEDVAKRVYVCISQILGIPLAHITLELSPKNVESWDSLMHLDLTLGLEEEFNLHFTPEEMESLISVGEIINCISKKKGKGQHVN
jgi:acyl carrier protein